MKGARQRSRLVLGIVIVSLGVMAGCNAGKSLTAQVQSYMQNQQVAPQQAGGGHEEQVGEENCLPCDMANLPLEDVSVDPSAWERIWAACPASPVAGYNYSVFLMRSGKVVQAVHTATLAAKKHPEFVPLQTLSRRLNAPYAAVGQIADARLKAWLATPSVHKFTLQPPKKGTPPPLPELVKGEFEKSLVFENRVELARKKRRAQLQKIEKEYEEAVLEFNTAVSAHNKAVEKERHQRAVRVPEMRARYLAEAMNEVFGNPRLVDPVYDADSERFHARLVCSSGLVDELVTVSVPLSEGRAFKESIQKVEPVIPYSLEGDRLVRGIPSVKLGRKSYAAMFSEEAFQPQVMTAMADVHVATGTEISPMTAAGLDMTSVLAEEESYFGEALSTQDNPQLAALRQKQRENDRKIREAQQRQAIEAERKRIEQQLQHQEQQLAELGGPTAQEFEGLREKREWSFPRAKVPARDMVAIVIGNRKYGQGIPLVPYAYNDAKAMHKFLVSGLGVAEENVILHQDATKGEMEGLFRRTLPNRVERGRTDLLVYFSGHGMPAEMQAGTKALLLPSDARPDTADITGYPRDRMLQQLASLNARSVTVVLDACFSGTAKDGQALIQGKPVFKKPSTPSLPKNAVLISASRANQISRMDRDSGMSLMTLHLLEGLSGKADMDGDHRVNVGEVKNYLERTVSRAARITFDMDQKPEVLGPRSRNLVVF